MWQEIVVNALCAVIAIAAVGVAVWALITGQFGEQGIDGLFLLTVCLVVALAFALIPVQKLRKRKPEKGKANAAS